MRPRFTCLLAEPPEVLPVLREPQRFPAVQKAGIVTGCSTANGHGAIPAETNGLINQYLLDGSPLQAANRDVKAQGAPGSVGLWVDVVVPEAAARIRTTYLAPGELEDPGGPWIAQQPRHGHRLGRRTRCPIQGDERSSVKLGIVGRVPHLMESDSRPSAE